MTSFKDIKKILFLIRRLKILVKMSCSLSFASPIIQNASAHLSRAKVYIDFGDHPGKDRIPREARLAGCVVITGIDGSAGFSKDVPIAHKVPAKRRKVNKIAGLIRTVLANYDEYDKQQQAYTESIKREKDDFVQQVKNLWII